MTDVPTTSADLIIDAREVSLSYGATRALDRVSLHIRPGEQVALMGPSGSGKSSLLHCLAGIVKPDTGSVTVNGQGVDTLAESARSRLRLTTMGMVFQFGDLVAELTLLENVALPLQLLGTRTSTARDKARKLLETFDIADVANRRAGAVSGGQAQRAAVARAMVHEPPVIFADEPTGSLDTLTAEAVLDALVALTSSRGAALLVVTHDHRVAAHLSRCVSMVDGRVTADSEALATMADAAATAGS
ncbi:MAG: ABC transporter ATP-binding protein [Nocardioidaceae bacterium]